MANHEVKLFFFLKEKEQVIVHLRDFDWDVQNFGAVYLYYGDKCSSLNYVGAGNIGGDLALLLTLNDPRFHSMSELETELKDYKGTLFLKR
jgi:hypothetical protein